MIYKDFLMTVTKCPFCDVSQDRIIENNDLGILTYSIAPYHKHHMMVVPLRHIEDLKDVTEAETSAIDKLLRRGVLMLESLGYQDYTIIVRNGDHVGKSIKHLHYHVVPSVVIGDVDHNGDERVVLTGEEADEVVGELKKVSESLK